MTEETVTDSDEVGDTRSEDGADADPQAAPVESVEEDTEGRESDSRDQSGGPESDASGPEEEIEGAASPEEFEEAEAEREMEDDLSRLQREFDELSDRHLRLAAEFNNYRRRQEAEMTEAWSRAQADLVRKLLGAVDDLQRVSDLDPADENVTAASIVEGVDLVERKLMRALEEAGVEVVEPEGEPFDPEIMEAMMREVTESEEEDDQVAQVLQKGYLFKGHLVRPARVSVYKAD